MNQENNSMEDKSKIDDDSNYYEIDLKVIFQGINRNKIVFFAFAFLFSLIGVVKSLKLEDIWKGEFQIVINDNKPQNPSIPGIDIERLSSFISTTATSDLRTQVKILRSPSVLMPAFNFFKEQKSLLGVDTEGMRYRDWINGGLKIDLESGTSVLTLNFEDNDKELILPVLRKISKIYQDYTTKKTKEELTQKIDFLENQIKVFNKKSQDSINELQVYSLENNILMPQIDEKNSNFLENSNNLSNSLFLMNPYNSLKIEIAEVNEQISFLKNNKDFLSGTLIISSDLDDEIILGLIEELKKIETEIQRKSFIFTEEDPYLIAIKNDSKLLKNQIRHKTIRYLKAKLLLLEKKKQLYTSPEEVVYKFRELFGLANRNSTTLQSYENALHSASLQLANANVPWKLITKPTLLQDPVGPVRSLIVFQHLFYGILISSIISVIKDLKKNVLYNQNLIQKIIGSLLLEKLSTKSVFDWKQSIRLLLNGPLENKDNESIALINIGNIEQIYLDEVNDIFKQNVKDRKLLLTNDIIEIKKANHKILIIQSGTISRLELSKFIQRINLQNIKISGWIFID